MENLDDIIAIWMMIISICFFCRNLFFHKIGLKKTSNLHIFLYILVIYIIFIIILFLINILMSIFYTNVKIDFFENSLYCIGLAFLCEAVHETNKDMTKEKLDNFLKKGLILEKNKSLIYLFDICADEHEKTKIQELYKLEKAKFKEKRIDLFKNDSELAKLFENKTNSEISFILDNLTDCSKILRDENASSYERYLKIKFIKKNYRELWRLIKRKACETENKN